MALDVEKDRVEATAKKVLARYGCDNQCGVSQQKRYDLAQERNDRPVQVNICSASWVI